MYTILLAIILLGNLNELFLKKEKLKKIIIFIIFFLMMLLSYYRNTNIGTDTINYVSSYENVPESFKFLSLYSKEKGFYFLMILFKKIGLSVHAFLGFVSFLSLLFLYLAIRKLTNYPLLAILIFYSRYYHLWILSGIRQGLVYCICMYSSALWLENKKVKVFLLILLSSLIHKSALIFIFFLLVSSIRINRKFIIILFLISYLLMVTEMTKHLINNLSYFEWRLGYYLLEDIKTSQIKVLRFILKNVSPIILFYPLFLNNKKKLLCCNLFLLGGLFYVLFSDISTFASRLGYFGFVFLAFILPYFIDLKLKINTVIIKKELIYLIVLLLTVVRFWQNIVMLPEYTIFIK